MTMVLRLLGALTNPRVLLAGIGIFFAALAAVSLRYFSQEQPLALLGGGPGGQAAQAALEADNVQVVGRSGGKVRWRLAAQDASLSQDRRTLSVGSIRRGAMYAADGHTLALLTADRAWYTTPFGALDAGGMGALTVAGHVKAQVQSASHPRLETEQVVWDSVSNALSCPRAVSAQMPKLNVTAGSARYDSLPGKPASGVMRLSGGVHASFRSTRGQATFACPGLVWSADTQTAQTLGPVSATIPGGLGTATASSMEASTRTGDLTGRGIRGTLRVSGEVQ